MMHEDAGNIAQDWHAFTARRLVANEFRIAESALLGQTRSTADIAQARQVAMYLAHVVYQLSYNDVAAAFGRERSTVSHACALVEDLRDDPAFDSRLDKLEERLQQLDRLRRGDRVERKSLPDICTLIAARA
ncbi:helix-turn-helix domain-containing protein [Parvularcula sp. LCG005]|uniref:helix-turn-helix domain-containing protein n=1 Tax=Parvularcula sp. LCG005 TaxID=3078805 RepID=UPI002942BD48|nr:helix-turn-helix domain-containing protein [Parvularcula sp. LCG005]WOI53971.1 helix-turn-helix domain-containing protein [Parvularcula sp. LCG005]